MVQNLQQNRWLLTQIAGKKEIADFPGLMLNLTNFDLYHEHTMWLYLQGYLDPEYILTHKLTDKSDVYSLGVVFLEILTGKQPILHGKNTVREVFFFFFLWSISFYFFVIGCLGVCLLWVTSTISGQKVFSGHCGSWHSVNWVLRVYSVLVIYWQQISIKFNAFQKRRQLTRLWWIWAEKKVWLLGVSVIFILLNVGCS